MSAQPPEGAPRLTVWIDTDGDEDQLHIRAEEDGTLYDELDLNVQLLAANNKYVEAFETPALTLLTLRNRAIYEEPEELVEEDQPAGPASGGD